MDGAVQNISINPRQGTHRWSQRDVSLDVHSESESNDNCRICSRNALDDNTRPVGWRPLFHGHRVSRGGLGLILIHDAKLLHSHQGEQVAAQIEPVTAAFAHGTQQVQETLSAVTTQGPVERVLDETGKSS